MSRRNQDYAAGYCIQTDSDELNDSSEFIRNINTLSVIRQFVLGASMTNINNNARVKNKKPKDTKHVDYLTADDIPDVTIPSDAVSTPTILSDNNAERKIPKDNIPKDNIPKVKITKDSISKNNITKDKTHKNNIPKDKASKDNIPKVKIPKHNISKYNKLKDKTSKDNTSKDNMPKNKTSKDIISKDTEPKDNMPKDTEPKDTTPNVKIKSVQILDNDTLNHNKSKNKKSNDIIFNEIIPRINMPIISDNNTINGNTPTDKISQVTIPNHSIISNVSIIYDNVKEDDTPREIMSDETTSSKITKNNLSYNSTMNEESQRNYSSMTSIDEVLNVHTLLNTEERASFKR